jgi:hypothetical protein
MTIACMLGALSLMACTAGPPLVSPTSPPAASPTPPATPSPAPSPAVERPTGATDVVLRMQRLGGFLWPGMTADVAPDFTLYGNGTVIYLHEEPRPGALPVRTLRLAQMNEEQIDALLEFALGSGGLANAPELYSDVELADAMTTRFTIDAGDVQKEVSVYALGEWEEPGPDAAHRQSFLRLQGMLGDFQAQVERDNATDAGVFEPDAYRLTLIADEFDELEPTAEWPWPDLAPDDFERDQSGFGVRTVTAEQGLAAAELPVGDHDAPVVVGPDGVQYMIRIRPLLPDELD